MFSQMVAELKDCRYAENAFSLLAGHEILAFEGYYDYQGSARVLAKRLEGIEGFYEYLYVDWSWGSCSGCDDWEARNLTDDEIIEEMRRSAARFETLEQVCVFLRSRDITEDKFTAWLDTQKN